MPQTSAEIHKIEDKEGVQFFPVTHVQAVIDNNGSSVQTLLSGKQATLVSGTNIKTVNNTSLLGSGNINIQGGGGVTEGTWSTIKGLRDQGELTPGGLYRITDYYATTSQTNTSSANVHFDIILLATSESSFSEEAKAAINNTWEGSSPYFTQNGAANNLDAWKVWYCIDNDTSRFAWADSSGKGVIYRLIDEFNNDCPYDFKGILFTCNYNLYDEDWIGYVTDWSTGSFSFFTFTDYDAIGSSSSIVDASVFCQSDFGYQRYASETTVPGVLNNKIEPYYVYGGSQNRIQKLNANIFVESNVSITLFNGFQNNILKQGCTLNAFAGGAEENVVGEYSYSNSLWGGCKNNNFESGCHHNCLGYGSCDNKFGENAASNTSLPYAMNNCVLRKGCWGNSILDASNCILGVGCFYISLYGNTDIVFGDGCNNISIPENSIHMKFAYNCHHIDFDVTGLYNITFHYPVHFIHFTGVWSNMQIDDIGNGNGTSASWATYIGFTSSAAGNDQHFGQVGSGVDFYYGGQLQYLNNSGTNYTVLTKGAYNSLNFSKIQLNYLDETVTYKFLPEEKRPLTFEILTSGTITWRHSSAGSAQTISYIKQSASGTKIISSIASTTSGASISVSAGDSIIFWGSDWPSTSTTAYRYFGGTATYEVYGNPASLKYGKTLTGTESLASYCYGHLFYSCTALKRAPVLPATTLQTYCYYYMFSGCTNLTEAPYLPAPTLALSCYNHMFSNCSNLSYIKADFYATATNATSYWLAGAASYGCLESKYANNMYTYGTSGIPSDWLVKGDNGLCYIYSTANWNNFYRRSSGGTEYTTKASAVTASGLSEYVFDLLMEGSLINVHLRYQNGDFNITCAPISYVWNSSTNVNEVL